MRCCGSPAWPGPEPAAPWLAPARRPASPPATNRRMRCRYPRSGVSSASSGDMPNVVCARACGRGRSSPWLVPPPSEEPPAADGCRAGLSYDGCLVSVDPCGACSVEDAAACAVDAAVHGSPPAATVSMDSWRSSAAMRSASTDWVVIWDSGDDRGALLMLSTSLRAMEGRPVAISAAGRGEAGSDRNGMGDSSPCGAGWGLAGDPSAEVGLLRCRRRRRRPPPCHSPVSAAWLAVLLAGAVGVVPAPALVAGIGGVANPMSAASMVLGTGQDTCTCTHRMTPQDQPPTLAARGSGAKLCDLQARSLEKQELRCNQPIIKMPVSLVRHQSHTPLTRTAPRYSLVAHAFRHRARRRPH